MDSDTSSEINSDYEEPIEEATEEEKNAIQNELSDMTFEELQKLKEEIGSKMLNKRLHGEKTTKQKIKVFKRVNKNRPREMSSKLRPRIVKKPQPVVSKHKKHVPRDPRFDERCGEFDKDLFRSNYKFVDDIKLNEKKQLKAELENAKDPQRRKQINLLIQRIDNQLREGEKMEKQELKRKEEHETIKQKKELGERPTYKRKSDKKIEDLVQKYEELKKNNKVHKHIERRSKKLQTKERRKLAYFKE